MNTKDIEYLKSLVKDCSNEDTINLIYNIISKIEHYDIITKTGHYFFLNELESKNAKEFYNEYVKGRYFGTIGGAMTYSFTPTGLGNGVVVSTINENGEVIKKDITDIDSW